MNSKSAQRILRSDAGPLSRLMNLETATATEWREQDLKAMLGHQLGAMLAFDLGREIASASPSSALPMLTQAEAMGIRTFRELLFHPGPPLELLKLAKDFFKCRSGRSSERSPDQQVAYVLYLLTIAAARVRCGQAITRLTLDEVSSGVSWVCDRHWVDAASKDLLRSFPRESV